MNDKNLIPVGLDIGNTCTNICIDGKVAKIPSRYTFERPPGAISKKTGQELKPVAFFLLFDEDRLFWFGRDTLGTGAIQKLDMSKYEANHISILFRAALYQWGRVHKTDLNDLGKMNVVASMPPGLFEKTTLNRQTTTAFRKAFNRGQSHVKVRDGKKTVQIVTKFGGLVREAVAWGQAVPRRGEIVLTVDLGGGTNDYALFNGSTEPLKTFTDNAGLLHAYSQIDSVNPAQVELSILRNKKGFLPPQLLIYFNEVERRIQLINLKLPKRIDRIYVIGGGAAIMTSRIRATFTALASKVIIKNEYANCEANWRIAGGTNGNQT